MSIYEHLLKPGIIGNLKLRNRIVTAPMGSNLNTEDGVVCDRLIRHYARRAEGGAGLVIVEVSYIDYPRGNAMPRAIALSDDKYIPGLARLTDAVHSHGAKIAIQLQHAGKSAAMDISNGQEVMMPSLPNELEPFDSDVHIGITAEEGARMVGNMKPGQAPKFHAVTEEDIRRIVSRYAEGAARAKRAGFDGVEIHAGHGYLIASFLSSYWNKRQDQYGGSLENRTRFLTEVIKAVRQSVGPDFPVWMRMNAEEYRMPGGIVLSEACQIAQIAEQAGIDALHVSAYGNPASAIAFTEGPLVHKPCGYLPLAAQVKSAVSVPVIAVGRITPEEGDKALKNGEADFVALGRQLLADPDAPNKLRDGCADAIRPCIYCYTCVGQIFTNDNLCCAVNPDVGMEKDTRPAKTDKPKKVLVVGGGPGGMEAARIAALRGHTVTLCEKSKRLGGTAFFAAVAYAENGKLVDYLIRQVESLPITLRLNQRVDRNFVEKLAPDEIIVATGAKREAPSLPGSDLQHVFNGDQLRLLMAGDSGVAKAKLSIIQRLMMAAGGVSGLTSSHAALRQLSKWWLPLGRRVVIAGGGLVGLELAEFLQERRHEVTVLEESVNLGAELAIPRRWRVLHQLREHGVELKTEVKLTRIDKSSVSYRDRDGITQSVIADTVIIAMGAQSNPALKQELAASGIAVHEIGDCAGVNYIRGAIADASRIANAI